MGPGAAAGPNLLAVGVSILVGAGLVGSAIFAGHSLGKPPVSQASLVPLKFTDVVAPSATRLAAKSSLLTLAEREVDPIVTGALATRLIPQDVTSGAKSDLIDDGNLMKPPAQVARFSATRIIPAVARLEDTWAMSPDRRKNIIRKRRNRIVQNDCLARAIYFEARSESELGQMAVAKVIMNRVANPAYPDTVCGVVYQGAHRRNSCQFSFACDGQHDNPRTGPAWNQSKRVAAMFVGEDPREVQVISAATHYHADYVRPRWAKSMRRLKKIGRHIFYHGS